MHVTAASFGFLDDLLPVTDEGDLLTTTASAGHILKMVADVP